MTIFDIYEILDLHLSRANQAALEIDHLVLDAHVFESFESIKTIDTFIYRFSKIQDYMGEKLFPAVLYLLGEHKPSMAYKDILNKLERLEIIPSSGKWMEFREIRNTLTHEYPDSEDEIIEGIKLALIAFNEIKIIYNNIKLNYH
jgi:uncharacterized protein with HEPN domain